MVIFPKSTKVRFDGAPLELLTILVNLRADQPFWWIGSKVELEVFDKKKVEPDLLLVDLELVNL